MKKTILLILIFISIMSTTSALEKNDSLVFYITRHGKTIFNTLDRNQGWSDSPLTPQGIKIAEYLGLGLKNIHFKATYSSDLGRARQTAHIVLNMKGQSDLVLQEEIDFREFCFGSYEGGSDLRMWTDVALYLHYKDTDEMYADFAKKPEMVVPMTNAIKILDTMNMAEDQPTVKARCQAKLKSIAEKESKSGGGNILIVSHGMAIEAMLEDLDSSGKIVPTRGTLENASISKVTYKEGIFTVESVGDMSFVERGKQAE